MTDASRKPPSATTAAANAAMAALVPDDPDDFTAATTGRIAPLPGPVVHPGFKHAVWDPADWAFITGDAPDSVHPSLWRQAQLNAIHGLFEVADGVYQVRGVDLSNITFIAGGTGWIVIDPLTASETAAFALDLLHAHLPARPVVAVIYTHSHVDHFGGVRGVTTDAAVASGEVEIIAPVGFLEAAIAENVVAGPAMLRRASYMYGRLLPGDPLGHVDCGLGKAIPLLGTSGLIAPTVEITHTGEERIIDGVRLRFQYMVQKLEKDGKVPLTVVREGKPMGVELQFSAMQSSRRSGSAMFISAGASVSGVYWNRSRTPSTTRSSPV